MLYCAWMQMDSVSLCSYSTPSLHTGMIIEVRSGQLPTAKLGPGKTIPCELT